MKKSILLVTCVFVLLLWSFTLPPTTSAQPNPDYPCPIWGGATGPLYEDVVCWEIGVPDNLNAGITYISPWVGYTNIVRWSTPINFAYGGGTIYFVFEDGHPFAAACDDAITFWDGLPVIGYHNYVVSWDPPQCAGINMAAQGFFKYSIIVEDGSGNIVASIDPTLAINVSPPPVGGIVETPQIEEPGAVTPDLSEHNYGAPAGIIVGAIVGVIALIGAVWYIRRRRTKAI